MTLILELPPELELKVREAANEDGVDVSVFLRKAAEDRLRQYDPVRSMSEGDLVTRINQFGFSEAF